VSDSCSICRTYLFTIRIAIDMPSINRSREAVELQDVYRKSLAASWGAQTGELPADQCVEDIFSGGDGWKSQSAEDEFPMPHQHLRPGAQQSDEDDYDRGLEMRPHHNRTTSDSSIRSMNTITGKTFASGIGHKYKKSRDRNTLGAHMRENSTSSLNSQLHGSSSEGSERGGVGFKHAHEVDEFDVREDLMAWRLPGTKL